MNITHEIELLAPAGSYEAFEAALGAGADAVYVGGPDFGARAYARNFTQEELIRAIHTSHIHGKKLYLTVNTLLKNRELKERLYDSLRPLYEEGLDAVIVQDFGVFQFIRNNFPELHLHASTQMTVTSVYSAKMLKEMGCCRVVPARELSLEEISRIYKETGMDIETFVHGALCYCYSGQCLMSSLIGGRSGNRGRCAQPCRLPYRVWEGGKAEGKSLNKENQKFVLSLKDLCTLDILPEILEAGVYSLKIEGRMKSPRYTAGVVRIYRKYLDLYETYGKDGYYVDPEDKKELLDLFDRGGFTSGYYGKHNGKDMVALKEKPEFREGNQKLFDFLDANYVEKEKKEPVVGKAVFEEGKPAVLELTQGNVTVKVEGQICQSAQNQPATEEKVRKQLNKTGATSFYFEQLDIELKGNIFLPVQALNELRREGFEKLTEKILAQWERKAESLVQTEQELPADVQSASKNIHSFAFLTASLEEECQLEPALSCDAVKRIYIDADGFKPDQWGKIVKQCEAKGKECFLTLPHIFRTHAMKFFSKNRKNLENAGFTGVRLGFTVVPKDLVRDGVDLHSLWARRHGTKFNGAPYIVQRAGEAVYSPEGKAQLKEQVGYYMSNAKAIYEGLASAGYSVSGGVNAPYIWLKTPDKMTSWEFFDYLLEKANIVGTPGSGFGAHGEGFFRLTAFGTQENTLEAIERIKNL
mgnify:CR=1 FL=1